jgi:ADP-ribose pyrophosphatase YjhB (NUDIX family)
MPKTKLHRYCLACGTALNIRSVENRARETCPACGWVYYEQLKVGAGAIIVKNGRILLLRRANSPWRGDWNLPAGYVEADEDPARAVERETLEETGLKVRASHLIDAYYFIDDPRGKGMLLVYACDIMEGVLRNSFESTEMCFFAPNEIPNNLCGAGHTRSIHAWQVKKG